MRKDIEAKRIYEEIIYAMDAYMLKKYRIERFDSEEIEKEVDKLINDFSNKVEEEGK